MHKLSLAARTMAGGYALIASRLAAAVTRNVKRWSSPSMALRWTAAAMDEAKKGFRRLKAFGQLPALRAALAAHYEKETNSHAVAQNAKAA
jgi:putative transposase